MAALITLLLFVPSVFASGLDLPEQPFRRIGGDDFEPFFRVRDMVMDQKENLYVLTDENDILKFDSSGTLVKTFGGKGQGPGLFTLALGLAWVEDLLWVSDLHRQEVTLFREDQVLKSFKVESAPISICQVGEKVVVCPMSANSTFSVFNLDGSPHSTFKVKTDFLDSKNPKMETLWSMVQVATLKDRELLLGLAFQPKLASIDLMGQLTSLWDVEHYYSTTTIKSPGGPLPKSRAASAFVEGPSGLVWVLSCAGDNPCSIYQFDLARQEIVKKIELAEDFSVMRIFKGSTLALASDEGFIDFYKLR